MKMTSKICSPASVFLCSKWPPTPHILSTNKKEVELGRW